MVSPAGRDSVPTALVVGAVVAVSAGLVFVSMVSAHGPASWLGAGLALVMLAIAVIDATSF